MTALLGYLNLRFMAFCYLHIYYLGNYILIECEAGLNTIGVADCYTKVTVLLEYLDLDVHYYY